MPAKKGEKKAEEKVLKHKGPKILKGKDELKVEDVTKAIEESKGKVKGVAGLLGKGGHVADRAGVGGQHLEHLAGGHVREGFFGLDDGQRAGQAGSVVFLVEVHLCLHSLPVQHRL